MKRYLLRLDDASEYMDLQKWARMERLLDQYCVSPIFGIIPRNNDESLTSKYDRNPSFWELVYSWINKGWIPAMHGYEHKYVTKCGGINPVNLRSEFAGLSYEEQAEKIRSSYRILKEHGIDPIIFFAPSHTFDNNTLKALGSETPIRIISDTVAWDVYKQGDFFFIPQQSGRVRRLPFRTVTFCYHPNTMDEFDFLQLESFINKHFQRFRFSLSSVFTAKRGELFIDRVIRSFYFMRKKKK